MNILAIETSCDETGAAIVRGEKTGEREFSFEVVGAALLSQAALHAAYGGVYPNLAKREHEKNLPIILEEALKNAGKMLQKNSLEAKRPEDFFLEYFSEFAIDSIAVTNGPGLEPALWTGIEFAKRLAQEKSLPLLPTNHMEGHLLSSLVSFEGTHGELKNISLPILALLISGGHTEFVLMREWLQYEIVGQTLDDAVGECFDKVARMLGLPYPGGPEISKLANKARQKSLVDEAEKSPRKQSGSEAARGLFRGEFSAKLPRPMIQTKDCNVSFSGLKTAALYALRDAGGIHKLSSDEIAAFAREFEDAVTDVLVAKTRRALTETGAKTFVIGGGVAANKHIRESLQALITEEFSDVEFRLPEISITGDNAIMIAIAALVRSLEGVQETPDPATIRAHGRLSISTAK